MNQLLYFGPSCHATNLEELEIVKYWSGMVDTSSHGSLKLMLILVQYFIQRKRIQIEVSEFHNLKGETAYILTMYIMSVLHKYRPSHKIIAFYWDVCNTHFDGVGRGGKKKIFTVLMT
jgi:hypothetical protein